MRSRLPGCNADLPHCIQVGMYELWPEELKKDREVVLAAVQQEGDALFYAAEELKKDLELVLAAVQQDGSALKYAAEGLKKDREVVLAAVQQDGGALQYAAGEVKRDRELVLAAMQQDGRVLQFAAEELKNDQELLRSFRQAIPQVASSCESETWVVRQEAVRALGEFAEKGHPLAIAAATTCLKDDDFDVREAAKAALAKLSKDGEGA